MKLMLMLVALSFQGFAQNAENGAKLYKKCMACHGKEGMGKKSQKAPMIAGQYDWYVQSQILAIKSMTRNNSNAKKMYPFVKNLDENEIAYLAAYISALPKKK